MGEPQFTRTERIDLESARSLMPGPPPPPWSGPISVPAKLGALAAGWTADERVLLVSLEGYGLIAPESGARLSYVRDLAHVRRYLAAHHYLGFTLPETGETVPVFGRFGGDGCHLAQDAWELAVIAPWWPRQLVALCRPRRREAETFYDLAHCLRIDQPPTPDGFHPLKCGFSPSGTRFLVLGHAGIELFGRP